MYTTLYFGVVMFVAGVISGYISATMAWRVAMKAQDREIEAMGTKMDELEARVKASGR